MEGASKNQPHRSSRKVGGIGREANLANDEPLERFQRIEVGRLSVEELSSFQELQASATASVDCSISRILACFRWCSLLSL